MENVLKNDWEPLLARIRKSIILLYPVFDRRIQHACCLSEGRRYFNALQYTSYENTKVVILGQDPYHNRIKRMV